MNKVPKAIQEELRALAALPDDRIDYTDIPPTTEADWQNAVRGRFYRPVKKQITVRVDADVLSWLQEKGKGYQTRLNQILRAAMLSELKQRRS
ncbi:MAG TPA: BrnA antitoxin family protein [Methylococcus sp.]|nr:BrnA antitoxin family protein [Methylococcus sp.]